MTTLALESRLLALADATRLRLLRVLASRELTVAELCAVLDLPQSTVSRHLKVLADEGFVASRRDGTSRYYRLRPQELDAGCERLWRVLAEDLARLPTAADDDGRLASVLASRRSRSQAFFASTAGDWDHLRRELFGGAPLAALVGAFDPDWVVGDLGCGTGELAALLARFVRRVVAVDAEANMLEAARGRLAGCSRVELRQGGLEALPVARAELDLACVVLVLHHLPEPASAFAELARVVRPGGRALVVEMQPHDHEEYRDHMGHVWLGFAASDLEAWMTQSAFAGVRVVPLPVDQGAKGPPLQVAVGVRS
jgi:SAM-dependent methyltransferase/DNA-binding MarR family transcriptional regulator